MKIIHKISSICLLICYCFLLYQGFLLCQFGGIHRRLLRIGIGRNRNHSFSDSCTAHKGNKEEGSSRCPGGKAPCTDSSMDCIFCNYFCSLRHYLYCDSLQWRTVLEN